MDTLTSYVPAEIMTLEIAATPKVVLIYLSTLPDGFYSTPKVLADKLGTPVRTINNCIKNLLKEKLIYKDASEILRLNEGQIRKAAELARRPEQTVLKEATVCSKAVVGNDSNTKQSEINTSCGKIVDKVVENSAQANFAESVSGKICPNPGKNCPALYKYTSRDLSYLLSKKAEFQFSKIKRKNFAGEIMICLYREERLITIIPDPEPDKPLTMDMISSAEAERAMMTAMETKEGSASCYSTPSEDSEAPEAWAPEMELFVLLTTKYEKSHDQARELITRMSDFYKTPTGWQFKKGRKREIKAPDLEKICKTWIGNDAKRPTRKKRFVDENGAPIAEKPAPIAQASKRVVTADVSGPVAEGFSPIAEGMEGAAYASF